MITNYMISHIYTGWIVVLPTEQPACRYISGCGCPIRFKMVAISSPHMHIQRIGLMKCFACFLTLQNACTGVGCPLTHPKSVALEASSLVKLYFNYHCSNIWMLAICRYIASYICISSWNVYVRVDENVVQ